MNEWVIVLVGVALVVGVAILVIRALDADRNSFWVRPPAAAVSAAVVAGIVRPQ
jgi:hypothetical protein